MEQEQEERLGRGGLKSSTGRGLGPLALILPLLAASLWVLHRLENRPGRGSVLVGDSVAFQSPPAAVAIGEAIPGWRGTLEREGGGTVEFLLAPLVTDVVRSEFQSAVLRERFGLPAGSAWRLVVRPVGADLDWTQLEVRDVDGELLRALVPAGSSGSSGSMGDADPMRTLYRAQTGAAAGGEVSLALWGSKLGAGVEILLRAPSGELRVPLAPAEVDASELPRSMARITVSMVEASPKPEPQLDSRDVQIEAMQAELDDLRQRRREREFEWWEFNRAMASLNVGHLLEPFPIDPDFGPEVATVEEAPNEEPEEVSDEGERRAAEIAKSMRALLRIESVYSFDPFELGRVEAGSTGPVTLRLLDDRGRLAGTLAAERLHIEASRSAHMITLVLEDGYESHRGKRVPFADGERRIVLAYVDPAPWIESMPELFSRKDRRPPVDDGRWVLADVRRELNRLLGLDIANGWYRVQGLGGVSGGALVDVNLDALDASGRLERRFFVDRLRISVEADGVLLLLEGGAMVRGDEKRSFLGGTHRVYLPNAALDAWRGAFLPGLRDPESGPENSTGG